MKLKNVINWLFIAALVVILFTIFSKVYSAVSTVFGWLKSVVMVPLTYLWNMVFGSGGK